MRKGFTLKKVISINPLVTKDQYISGERMARGKPQRAWALIERTWDLVDPSTGEEDALEMWKHYMDQFGAKYVLKGNWAWSLQDFERYLEEIRKRKQETNEENSE